MTPPPARRIVILLPCCIGDVVMGTAALVALRQAYPRAAIAWAVGSWSRPVLVDHPLIDRLIDLGDDPLPRTPAAIWRWGRAIAGHDLLVALGRSPRLSAVALASGVGVRAGLDSGGRGFGYTIRAPITPDSRRHEVTIYLDVIRALGIDPHGAAPHIPLSDADRADAERLLGEQRLSPPYLVVHPGGGGNPGMTLDAKRYPPEKLARLIETIAQSRGAGVVIVGGAADAERVADLRARLIALPTAAFSGSLSFRQIGALALGAEAYIGHDTGATHYAAAAGARTVMIMGPTDPLRYAPYNRGALTLWRPTALPARGVAAGAPTDWDWDRDGIDVDSAITAVQAFLR